MIKNLIENKGAKTFGTLSLIAFLLGLGCSQRADFEKACKKHQPLKTKVQAPAIPGPIREGDSSYVDPYLDKSFPGDTLEFPNGKYLVLGKGTHPHYWSGDKVIDGGKVDGKYYDSKGNYIGPVNATFYGVDFSQSDIESLANNSK